MSTGYWRKRRYAKEPLLPIISVRTDSRKEIEYYDAFNELINVVTLCITPHVNYAHVHSCIPRRNLPLRFEGMHMDLAYLTLRETLVQAQVHITPKRRIPAKYLGVHLYDEPTPGE